MANYWRRFFRVDEIPDDDTTDPETPENPDPSQDNLTAPGPIPYTESHGHLQIPLHLVQMAWMLDSVLNQVDPALHPELTQLHQRMSSGTILDFTSLNHHELSALGTVLAITAHQLSRQADPSTTPAHEVALPSTSDEGL